MDSIILSDLHLSDSEPINEKRPLWKKFKNKEFFIDEELSTFIKTFADKTIDSSCELILNGDIFDFDSVMSIPEEPSFPMHKYEKETGLGPDEDKSVFKINKILTEHSVFVEALRYFLNKNCKNKIIFIIGNHDLELNWIKVQEEISLFVMNRKNYANLVFCEWFYISNNDTLIEHGHQYDPYCMALNPINPLIKKNGRYIIRLPFGNLANRFIINKMGLKNPHNDESYRKTFMEFVEFFIKYELKYQPLLVMYWFLGSIKTLIYSVGESFLPTLKDPLTTKVKLENIAQKANASIAQVFLLHQNHAHPAVRKPWSVIKEMWLDRAFFSFFIIFFCWLFFSTSSLFTHVDSNWFWIPLLILQPFFFFYAHNVSSDIQSNQEIAIERAPLIAKACNVYRVIHGHTHRASHSMLDENIEYINTGTWSVFFKDIECTQKIKRFTFAWIKHNNGKERDAGLYEWSNQDYKITKESENFYNDLWNGSN